MPAAHVVPAPGALLRLGPTGHPLGLGTCTHATQALTLSRRGRKGESSGVYCAGVAVQCMYDESHDTVLIAKLFASAPSTIKRQHRRD